MIDETRLHQRLREWQEQPAKITSGPVRVRANERTCSFEIEPADGCLTAIAVVNSMSPGRREQDAEADAHFIADAFNVHHETGGLTLRELAEQRTELLEALGGCIQHMEWSTPQGRAAYETAKATIAKARGGAA